MLGRKPYEEVAAYQAAMDVLIMPWNDSEWIKACNPIKLKEYLAVGRPIVTTDFAALECWRDLVSVAGDAARFAAAIDAATGKRVDVGERLRRLDGESWDAKAGLLARRLAECPEMAVERAA
jgi:glycosyltransferase involved in cell wall biosynthesis